MVVTINGLKVRYVHYYRDDGFPFHWSKSGSSYTKQAMKAFWQYREGLKGTQPGEEPCEEDVAWAIGHCRYLIDAPGWDNHGPWWVVSQARNYAQEMKTAEQVLGWLEGFGDHFGFNPF